jgi:hypothetical protein
MTPEINRYGPFSNLRLPLWTSIGKAEPIAVMLQHTNPRHRRAVGLGSNTAQRRVKAVFAESRSIAKAAAAYRPDLD